jgi:hypothetical protein
MQLVIRRLLCGWMVLTGLSLTSVLASEFFSPPPRAGALPPQLVDRTNEQQYWSMTNQQAFQSQSQARLARPELDMAQANYQQAFPVTEQTAPFERMSQPSENNPQSLYPSDQQADHFWGTAEQSYGPNTGNDEPWTDQWLPEGLIYRSYLAGDREPRLRSFMFNKPGYGWLWDITLGGRVALYRYGTTNTYNPEGFQIDMEGAALPRLDFEHDMNMVSTDFRAGLPITYGIGQWKYKTGYYHLSSHLGDEQMLSFPGLDQRYNYARDCLMLGVSYYATPEWRLYVEADWAFYADVAQEWEFQFGTEYSPAAPTGSHGAPFFAMHGHLREEINFSGNLVVQTGWAWRNGPGAKLFRLGLEYFNGLSDQYQFWNQFEEKLGFGIWYDY